MGNGVMIGANMRGKILVCHRFSFLTTITYRCPTPGLSYRGGSVSIYEDGDDDSTGSLISSEYTEHSKLD